MPRDYRRYRKRMSQRSSGKPSRYALNALTVRAHEFVEAPPAHVLAERDAALHAPQSITGAVFGDPASGRSALDRRGRE